MEKIAVAANNKNAGGEAKNGGEHAVNGSDETKTATITITAEPRKGENRIQVSNTKKPLLFYLKLARKYIKEYNNVELSALGMAIPTVVIISENLKRNGLAIEKNIMTSTVGAREDKKGRLVLKAKIEILLEKAGKKDQSTFAATLDKCADNKA